MLVLKITLGGTDGPALVLNQDQVRDILVAELDALFDGGEAGDSLVLTLADMTQEDFDRLDEFEGF